MPTEYDFDILQRLFREDPEKAQKLADTIIEDAINSMDVPEDKKQRLKAANFRLQQDLRKYKHPIARLQRMEVLFWEQFNKFRIAMETPSVLMVPKNTENQTKVVPFRKTQKDVDTK